MSPPLDPPTWGYTPRPTQESVFVDHSPPRTHPLRAATERLGKGRARGDRWDPLFAKDKRQNERGSPIAAHAVVEEFVETAMLAISQKFFDKVWVQQVMPTGL